MLYILSISVPVPVLPGPLWFVIARIPLGQFLGNTLAPTLKLSSLALLLIRSLRTTHQLACHQNQSRLGA